MRELIFLNFVDQLRWIALGKPNNIIDTINNRSSRLSNSDPVINNNNSFSRILPFNRSISLNTVSSLANESTFNSDEFDGLFRIVDTDQEVDDDKHENDDSNTPKVSLMNSLRYSWDIIRYYSFILVSNIWFDRFMLLVILLSSCFLAMADYRFIIYIHYNPL